MTPAIATAPERAKELSAVIPEGETILLMIRPAPWFIVSTSLRAVPAAAAAGGALMIAALDPSIPWDFRGAIFASVAIILARASWQTIDWFVRLYVLTDRRIVVRRGVIPEVSECMLTEVAGIGQPRRWEERIGRTGSLAVLAGPSRRVRRVRRARQARALDQPQAQGSASAIRRDHPRVRVDSRLEWAVIRNCDEVRRTILAAVSRAR